MQNNWRTSKISKPSRGREASLLMPYVKYAQAPNTDAPMLQTLIKILALIDSYLIREE